MEINLKNAFPVAIRLSLKPCVCVYKTAKFYLANETFKTINYILERPVLTTCITLSFMIVLIIMLLPVFLLFLGISCIIVNVMVLEGVFITCLALVIFNCAMVIIIIIMMVSKIAYF